MFDDQLKFPNNLLEKRKLLMVTGKGGVGKSIACASLGLLAAEKGKNVLIIESSIIDQIAPLFGLKENPHKPQKVQQNLHILNLDPRLNFKDFIVDHLGFAKLFDTVFSQNLVKSFLDVIPGLLEMTLLGRLYYESKLKKNERYDLIIFDSYSSGHHYSLLDTPKAILKSKLSGKVFDEVQDTLDFLSSSQVGSVVVSLPEDLVFTETKEYLQKLNLQNIVKIDALLVNRVLPLVLSRSLRLPFSKHSSEQEHAFATMVERNFDYCARHQNLINDYNRQTGDDVLCLAMMDNVWIEEPITTDCVRKLWKI